MCGCVCSIYCVYVHILDILPTSASSRVLGSTKCEGAHFVCFFVWLNYVVNSFGFFFCLLVSAWCDACSHVSLCLSFCGYLLARQMVLGSSGWQRPPLIDFTHRGSSEQGHFCETYKKTQLIWYVKPQSRCLLRLPFCSCCASLALLTRLPNDSPPASSSLPSPISKLLLLILLLLKLKAVVAVGASAVVAPPTSNRPKSISWSLPAATALSLFFGWWMCVCIGCVGECELTTCVQSLIVMDFFLEYSFKGHRNQLPFKFQQTNYDIINIVF